MIGRSLYDFTIYKIYGAIVLINIWVSYNYAAPSTIYHQPSTLFTFGEKHLVLTPSTLNFALPFVPGT